MNNFVLVYDVAIIGGGLAGLVNAFLLKKNGYSVVLFEGKKYPFHRVCGEYISNEVVPFLQDYDLYPKELGPSKIEKFRLTSTSGKLLQMNLDLGGFGISRHAFDHWLVQKLRQVGVEIREKERVNQVTFADNFHEIETSRGSIQSRLVIGCFGKKARLDHDLNRHFVRKKSPYVGVKYHVKTDIVDQDTIELHNFSGGYCGVSKVENDTFNLCYLSHRENLRRVREISAMEESVLHRNPYLKRLFSESEFLFEKPIVINEISFEKKEPVFNHILMSGDSAGMITPLCGNGMAMAIHSSKILSAIVSTFLDGEIDRSELEKRYTTQWNSTFSARHWAGRKIQKLFGSSVASGLAVGMGKTFPSIARYLMSKTHGKPF